MFRLERRLEPGETEVAQVGERAACGGAIVDAVIIVQLCLRAGEQASAKRGTAADRAVIGPAEVGRNRLPPPVGRSGGDAADVVAVGKVRELVVVIAGIDGEADDDLALVVEAFGGDRGVLGAAQRRQQHRGENSNDGNDHEQLDERERSVEVSFHKGGGKLRAKGNRVKRGNARGTAAHW